MLLLLILIGCKQETNSSITGNKLLDNSRVERLPYYEDATFSPYWLKDNEEIPESFHKIPAFELVNQNADTITEKAMEGKITITDFFFTTCPGICPRMTENMKVVQEAFLNDDSVMLLSHSVTPDTDTPEVLKRYAEAKNAVNGKWHLLTGERSTIYNLGRKQYFVEEDLGLEKSDTEFLHTENFILVDQNRHIRGIYNGLNKASVSQLIADIKTLSKES